MKKIFALCFLVASVIAIKAQERHDLKVPTWLNTAVIYEVNIRQYTPEGTIAAFTEHLPRLRKMGIRVLWLMPIYPVSFVKRKGPLGSYYAISSYTEVNPEFGTKRDLRELIERAHSYGMKIILDWVPNHTGWDHSWIASHPDWYMKDPVTDTIVHPAQTDWYDVAELNYDSASMRREMIHSMKYWLDAFHIDGFRCDVASMVPVAFWQEVKTAFSKYHRPVFMLAESEDPQLLNRGYFHVDYGWKFMHLCRDLYSGTKSASDLRDYLKEDVIKVHRGYHMFFTSNHDENSWKGPESELLGDSHPMFAAMSFVLNGVPLIYSGQEEPLMKKLRFFEKDTISFGSFSKSDFYAKLCALRKAHPALHPEYSGMQYDFIQTNKDMNIVAVRRKKAHNEVLSFFNCSAQPTILEITSEIIPGTYQDGLHGTVHTLKKGSVVELKPWDYRIFTIYIR